MVASCWQKSVTWQPLSEYRFQSNAGPHELSRVTRLSVLHCRENVRICSILDDWFLTMLSTNRVRWSNDTETSRVHFGVVSSTILRCKSIFSASSMWTYVQQSRSCFGGGGGGSVFTYMQTSFCSLRSSWQQIWTSLTERNSSSKLHFCATSRHSCFILF